MRNDARPMGSDNPLGAEDDRRASRAAIEDSRDQRESVTHDRQAHIVNQAAVEDGRRDDLENLKPQG
jgi:hypothetical protein